jgi:predicted Rossmann fold nucleotide-binding protein DprA/Smf involved in DNA uptake
MMSREIEMELIRVKHYDPAYPVALFQRINESAPASVAAIGDINIMRRKRLGLICSVRCPGSVVLKIFDAIRDLRDAGITVIGGFHSPMEKECLGLLLRGAAPVIICPARSIEKMRIPTEWKGPCAEGRLLIFSPFDPTARRVTTELATARNEFVANIAEALFVPHASPGGKTERLIRQWINQSKQVYTVDDSENSHLLGLGVRPLTVAALSETLKG